MRTIMTGRGIETDQSLPKTVALWILASLALVAGLTVLSGLTDLVPVHSAHPQPTSVFRGVPWAAIALYCVARLKALTA